MRCIMNKINFINVISNLLKKRPVFHSEADFQHHLAWEIHKEDENINISLEKKMGIDDFCIDIFVSKGKSKKGNSKIGFELKYVTNKLKYEKDRELFDLRDQSAYDVRCYDFLKDIYRLETLKSENLINRGYAILLTNCKAIWNGGNDNTGYESFKVGGKKENIDEGEHEWGNKVGEGTKRGRKDGIKIGNTYKIEWSKPSEHIILNVESKHNEFRYLIIEI